MLMGNSFWMNAKIGKQQLREDIDDFHASIINCLRESAFALTIFSLIRLSRRLSSKIA